MTAQALLTPYQAIDIVAHIENFLRGIDPPWQLNLQGDVWELTAGAESVCTFPLIPRRADLTRMVRQGCEAAPEHLLPVWKAYLSYLAEETIPQAFIRVGLPLGS